MNDSELATEGDKGVSWMETQLCRAEGWTKENALSRHRVLRKGRRHDVDEWESAASDQHPTKTMDVE